MYTLNKSYVSDFYNNTALFNATNSTVISYSGLWSSETDGDIPSADAPGVPFVQTSQQNASLSFQFMGEAIELHGSLDFDHGLYSVVSKRIRARLLQSFHRFLLEQIDPRR